jgi:hypothetical protein
VRYGENRQAKQGVPAREWPALGKAEALQFLAELSCTLRKIGRYFMSTK